MPVKRTRPAAVTAAETEFHDVVAERFWFDNFQTPQLCPDSSKPFYDANLHKKLASTLVKPIPVKKATVAVPKAARTAQHVPDPDEWNDGDCGICGSKTPYCKLCSITWCIGCEHTSRCPAIKTSSQEL